MRLSISCDAKVIKIYGMAIAKRSVERRLAAEFGHPNAPSLRARCAQSKKPALDDPSNLMQVLAD